MSDEIDLAVAALVRWKWNREHLHPTEDIYLRPHLRVGIYRRLEDAEEALDALTQLMLARPPDMWTPAD